MSSRWQEKGRGQQSVLAHNGERYRPAIPGGGATGAPEAGVPLAGVCSGAWLNEILTSLLTMPWSPIRPLYPMKTISVSKAKAQFSGIARRVVRTKRPVTITTPAGMVQLIPWNLPAVVEPFPLGTVRLTAEETRLANTLGETFGEETP
jgi:hypothetical protein